MGKFDCVADQLKMIRPLNSQYTPYRLFDVNFRLTKSLFSLKLEVDVVIRVVLILTCTLDEEHHSYTNFTYVIIWSLRIAWNFMCELEHLVYHNV